MKSMKKSLCILLACACFLGVFVGCDGGNPSGGDGDRDENGGWTNVDFGGQTVNVCISTNKWRECYFPSGDLYTRGPDSAGSNEVAKEVLARNNLAEETLGITLVYTERDLDNQSIQEDIRAIVQTAAKNSPDVYNNDLYGIARAMIDGMLLNLQEPVDGVKNYFDFAADGWNLDYMKGCTFDQEKLYILAGDYFIDLVRMAWAILVNHDLFNASLGNMPNWCKSIEDFYDFVDDGFWDLDMLATFSSAAFSDGGVYGKEEKTDARLGLYLSRLQGRLVSAASQVTTYYQDESFKPRVLDSIDVYQKVANEYVALTEEQGVLYEEYAETPYHIDPFLWGNVMFCFSPIGEMESELLRNFSAEKGLVPLPKWNASSQDEYFTPVHDQAELGCILKTAKAFSAASALMQFLNEESSTVIHSYYEKGLKYKYNDNKNARKMMDIVRETTDSPFSWQIGVLCERFYAGTSPLIGLSLIKNTTVNSTFESEKAAYDDCMKQMLAHFEKIK